MDVVMPGLDPGIHSGTGVPADLSAEARSAKAEAQRRREVLP
jgi:hypothetical protein